MEIKLKSNRKFLYYITIPFITTFSLAFIAIIVAEIIAPAGLRAILPSIIIVLVFDIIEIGVFLFAKYYKGKSYTFNKESIHVFDKGVFVKEIKINKIESMHYYPWRIHYILTIFLGVLNEGGAWKIHILKKDGTRHEIGFLSEKDAIMLQEKIYPNTLEIMYDKRKHSKLV